MAEREPTLQKPDPYSPSFLPRDEHLNPFPEELDEPRLEGLMSEWEKNYQARIEQLTPDEKILSREQEIDLSQKIQAGIEAAKQISSSKLSEPDKVKLADVISAGKDARDTLVTTNLRLAAWFVRQTMDFNREARLKRGKKRLGGAIFADLANFRGDKLDYSERMQIATLGLIEAADKYTGEGAFTSFAMYHMEGQFYRGYVMEDSRSPLSISLNRAEELVSYRKKVNHDNPPSLAEAAKSLDWTIEKTAYMRDLDNASQNISLEVVQEILEDHMAEQSQNTPEDDLPKTISDILTDPGVDQTVFDEVALEDLGFRLDAMLAELPDREQAVLELRFGLNGDDPMTNEEIGRIFGLTRERIRQIESQALAMLRNPKRSGQLLEYIESEDPTLGQRTELSTTPAQDASIGVRTPQKSSASESKRFFGSTRGEYVYRPRPTYTLQQLKEMKEREGNE